MLWVPRQGASNEYPQHTFLWRNKKYRYFLDEKKKRFIKSYKEVWIIIGSEVSGRGTSFNYTQIFLWRIFFYFFIYFAIKVCV